MNAHFVGGIVDRWGLNGNFKGIPVEADNLVPGRTGLNIDIEYGALGRLSKKRICYCIGDQFIQ
jgi:hypothetical protein